MQMNDYQRYYIYTHTDPRSSLVRYIGVGCGGRAWQVKDTQRSAEHRQWIVDLESEGYYLDDIVTLIEKNLSKELALKREADYVKVFSNLFNKIHTEGYKETLRKRPPEVWDFAKALHQMGYGYQRIAFLLGADNPKQHVMGAKRLVQYAS